jgi:hypothetical protein
VERLKSTTYRATIDAADGGSERLFSLLDEIETSWTGPDTSPYRHVRAVYSRTAMELVSAPRMLRPIDLDALRRLGPQRDLARRLFLFLEASTGHPASESVEIVERIIDQRLAATLGTTASPSRLASQLHTAGLAVEAAAPRYTTVRVIPRRKKCLAPGEPAYALFATRRRLAKTPSNFPSTPRHRHARLGSHEKAARRYVRADTHLAGSDRPRSSGSAERDQCRLQ